MGLPSWNAVPGLGFARGSTSVTNGFLFVIDTPLQSPGTVLLVGALARTDTCIRKTA